MYKGKVSDGVAIEPIKDKPSVRVSKQSNSAEDGLREISRSVDQMVT
jgi:hypothetical protein